MLVAQTRILMTNIWNIWNIDSMRMDWQPTYPSVRSGFPLCCSWPCVLQMGMPPDPKKFEALQNVAPPSNASEVRGLLSSAAFPSRFIKDSVLITRPLRQLTDLRWSTVAMDTRGTAVILWTPESRVVDQGEWCWCYWFLHRWSQMYSHFIQASKVTQSSSSNKTRQELQRS